TRVGEPARVPQRRLLLVVPARPAATGQLGAGPVGVDDLRRRHHRVGSGLARHRDPIFDFGAHDSPYRHVATSFRCPMTSKRSPTGPLPAPGPRAKLSGSAVTAPRTSRPGRPARDA